MNILISLLIASPLCLQDAELARILSALDVFLNLHAYAYMRLD